uniref:Putative ovule protein n=1 Tax=Solanum chacoense TaxID=4108 RepID=A0A0V0HHU5_SOLCH
MFDDNFVALPCWPSVFSRTRLRGRSIFDYFREFDHANLPLSLYRFPPDQFEFSFPFDPGSSLLPVFLALQTIIYAWLWMFSRRSLGYSRHGNLL